MGRHSKTTKIIDQSYDILADYNPMTVRQVYYQLVSRQVTENTRSRYQAVSNALVDARKDGIIPWKWIEDRLRKPREVAMWFDLSEFGDTVVRAYRRDVWETQENYIEVWLEKDALSGIFEDELNRYGVTLNVGRGYDGWDSIRNAAERYQDAQNVTVLYFGDFDPSGEDMVRSLRERLAFFECEPTIIKCALNADDVTRYNLPPALPKKTDTRRKKFVAEHGEVSVELDALPAEVLRNRVVSEIEDRMDLDALAKTQEIESLERSRLENYLKRTKRS